MQAVGIYEDAWLRRLTKISGFRGRQQITNCVTITIHFNVQSLVILSLQQAQW